MQSFKVKIQKGQPKLNHLGIFLGILWVSDCLILLVDRQHVQSQWAMGHRRSRILRHPLAICGKLAEENVLVKHLPDLPALNRGSKLNHLHNSTQHKDNHCWGAKPHQVICIAAFSKWNQQLVPVLEK